MNMRDDGSSALNPAQAYAALEGYAERYGRLPLLLLTHVAVPQSFRADLVNLTKLNFIPEGGDDLMVDADVLFSPLVKGLGAGFYRLDPEIRHQCLILLDAIYRHGPERRRVSVARFLLAYLNDLDRRPQSLEDPLLAEYIDIERQLAAAIVDPAGAAERIARALKNLTGEKTVTRVHLTEMATALSIPLAGYPELLSYARGVGALQSGNEEEAERLLTRLGGEAIRVGDTTLPPAAELLRDTRNSRARRKPFERDRPEPPPSDSDASSAPPHDITYRYGVYVSSAHVDDEPVYPADRGWVSVLLANLKQYLAVRRGDREADSIWYDQRRLPRDRPSMDYFPEQVRQSRLILVILSPGWVSSEFCRRELAAFVDSHHGDVDRRIFVVERMPVESGHKIPEVLQDLNKYRFYRLDKNKAARTFGLPLPSPDESEYLAGIDDLARDIADQLRSTETARSTASTESSKPAALVAEVTDDLDSRRQELSRYLEQAGIEVLPLRAYGLARDEFERSMIADIARSALFVQLLGGYAGRRPPDVPDGFLWLQYDLAKRSNVPILQWRSPDLDVSTIAMASQRRLLGLETVHAMPFEEFKRKVADDFNRLTNSTPVGRQGLSEIPFIFINADRVDRASAEMIGKLLGDRGVDWVLPLSSGGGNARPEELRRELEENLIECDGMIIVYGAAPPAWVQQQLRLYRKLAHRRKSPPRLLALVQAPPMPKASIPIRLPGLIKIDMEGVSEALDRALSQ
jgi:hypothetical protein